jgi:hypothetical protein
VGIGAGVYLGGSNACDIHQIKGQSIYGGRAGLGYFGISGYSNSAGLKGGGITIGPSIGYTFGLAGATNTIILSGFLK